MPAREPRKPPTRGCFSPSVRGKQRVEPESAAGYRFFPIQPRDLMEYATLKRRLDVGARTWHSYISPSRYRIGGSFRLRPIWRVVQGVDLKLFYPKPFKQVSLEPDAKA